MTHLNLQLMTGRIPYEHMQYGQVVVAIMNGVTPVQPDDTVIHDSEALHSLLNKCWTPEPSSRPTMSVVQEEVSTITIAQ